VFLLFLTYVIYAWTLQIESSRGGVSVSGIITVFLLFLT
jgi:hypothetical protein